MSPHLRRSPVTFFSKPFATALDADALPDPYYPSGLGCRGVPTGTSGPSPTTLKDRILCGTPFPLTSILPAQPHALTGTSRDHPSAQKYPTWDLGSGFRRCRQRSGRVQAGVPGAETLWERQSP